MSAPSPHIPFLDRGSFVASRAAPEVSVRLRATRRDIPRAVLLRVYRAAGAVADREGGWDRLEVRLLAGRRRIPLDVVAAGRMARIGLHLEHARLPFHELERQLTAGFAEAGSAPDPGPGRVARPARRSPGSVLLLDNPFLDPDRPDRPRPEMAGGTFRLASSLRGAGIPVRLVAGRWCADEGLDPWDGLSRALADPGASLLGLTALEGCFDAVRVLAARARREWGGYVVLGGPMPTLAPVHTLAHAPGADLVVRGPGEGTLPILVRLLTRAPDAGVQRALLGLEGVLFERDGLLLAGHLGRVPDSAPTEHDLDFSLLRRRHLAHGLSLETARGCSHGCSFCTTPGRGRYRGGSGAAVARQLGRFQARLAELFGERPPRITRRVQLCDDDFACDSGRAIEVLGACASSGLELAALQASVGDFVGRDGALDEPLLDALRPGLFQDADRRPRWPTGAAPLALPGDAGGWVHLGVESFADAELRRLGKGYRVKDAVAVVDALDRRGVVHDAYLILANRDTTLDDLVDTLVVVARLKLQHPETFFLRLPVVPYLVPVFPSRRFRSLTRDQPADRLAERIDLAGTWSIPGHPELDYPRVVRERPVDPDVDAACRSWAEWLTARHACAPAAGLRAWLVSRLGEVGEPRRVRRLRRAVRRLDGLERRIVFRGISGARSGALRPPIARRYWSVAARLGPANEVAQEARAMLETGDPRLVVIPTRDCSLRCTYCPSEKRAGCEMDQATLDSAVELLLSADSTAVILQFFGGEALLRRDFVLAGIERALDRAAAVGKRLGVILSTNGSSLDADLLSRLRGWPVKLELSLDGDREVQNRHRRSAERGGDSYAFVPRAARALVDSELEHEVIAVVTPDTADRLAESFAHVAGLGFRRIQVNFALAARWSRSAKEAFAAALGAIERRFYAEDELPPLEWINLRSFRHPMLLNGEITVDHDGTVHHGNGFLIRSADRGAFLAGHLDDLTAFDVYAARRPGNAYLVRHTYPPDVIRNNTEVGRIYGSFVRHMRDRFPSLKTVDVTQAPREGEGV